MVISSQVKEVEDTRKRNSLIKQCLEKQDGSFYFKKDKIKVTKQSREKKNFTWQI